MEWAPASELVSPWEWRFTVGYNGGLHTQRLQIDYKPKQITQAESATVAVHCWRAVVAPLLSTGARLEVLEVVQLGPVPTSLIIVPGNVTGTVPDEQCHPSFVPVWVTHTVDTDRWARRPFYFPGSPRSWVHEGVLTPTAADRHLTYGRAFAMGFGECWTPGTMQAIRYREGAPFGGQDAPVHATYRRVLHTRVCHHCDKPPAGLGPL